MSKISIIAKLTAAEGKASELEAAMARLIAAAEDESGLEIYSAHKDPKNEGVYYFFEMYSNREALKVHGKSDQMKEAITAMGSLVSGRSEISVLEPIVAKGLTV
jgi:quinol monooxygenase YgiN